MPNTKRRTRKLRHRSRREARNAYKYQPLDEGTIRLLKLLPGREVDELACSLVTVPLDGCPNYEAVSYCWGDPEPPAYVRCEHDYVRITTNLASGLRQLRYLNEPRLLWADQVCINQEDIPERSAQVNIMDRIFKRAFRVAIWLGPDPEANPQAPLVMEVLKKLASFPRPHLIMEIELVQWGLPPSSSPAWTALRGFLKLPYFSRVWILPELALASTRVMLWGATVIDLDVLYKSRHNLASIPSNIIVDQDTYDNYDTTLCMLRFAPPISILDTARLMSTRKTKDQRDFIFALLGMTDYIQRPVVADYSKSLVEVFTSAIQLFQQGAPNHLYFLSSAGTQMSDVDAVKGAEDWPSWIPDWTVERLREVDDYRPSFNASAMEIQHNMQHDSSKLVVDGIYLETISQVLQLDPSHKQGTPRSICHRLIATHNFCGISKQGSRSPNYNGHYCISSMIDTLLCGSYDDIDWKECGYDNLSQRHEAYKDFVALMVIVALDDLCDGILDSLQDLEARLKIVHELAAAGWLPEGGILALRVMEGLSSRIRFSSSTQRLKLLYKQSPDSVSSDVKEIIEFATEVLATMDWTEENKLTALKRIMASLWTVGDWRRLPYTIQGTTDPRRLFFITECGSMGMGPPAIQPGDVVVILFGARVPFILRPTKADGVYRLIGECYVNGIMHGEHIEKLKAEGKLEESTRRFTLV